MSRATDAIAVVEPKRHLVLERAQVADVDDRQHARQPLALEHAAEQRLAAGPDLGGVEIEAVEQRPRLGHARNVDRGLAGVERHHALGHLPHFLVERRGEWSRADAFCFENTQREDPAQGFVHAQGQTLRARSE